MQARTVNRTAQRRFVLALLVLAALAPLTLLRPSPVVAAENGPIVATALKYLDTHGGQCWTFMHRVVAEATGRRVGFDYRSGYFEAGAIEVSAAEARNGDIIQIASDSRGNGFYPGLHTAIIIENLGNGRFNAIDSNQNWDEWVRLRPNYDPYAAAARYGLQVRIYRIPGGGPGDDPGVSAQSSRPLGAGDEARVTTSGCLNLRTQPSLRADRISCLPTGTPLALTGPAVSADGYTWVPVDTPAGSGWVAAEFITRTAVASTASAAPDPSPAAEPTPAPPAAEPTPAASVPPAVKVAVGDGCLRLRGGAGLDASILDCLAGGTAVVPVPGTAPVAKDGFTWMRVDVPGRTGGWVASEFLTGLQ
jgi:uncharacterized protein YraI